MMMALAGVQKVTRLELVVVLITFVTHNLHDLKLNFRI
jgi:hypothetical protein